MSDTIAELPVSIGGRHFARRVLYDRIWAAPMSIVAKEIGVSDQALAKACRRAAIPTPPRGHWAKLAAGRPVKAASFVEADPRLKPPATNKPHPDGAAVTSAYLASLASRPRPELPPLKADPPMAEYVMQITSWSWAYGVGEQGEGWSHDAEDYDVWLECEDLSLIGIVTDPERLAGRELHVFVQPAAPGRRYIYSDLDRAQIGILQFEQSPIVAEVAIPQSAASRLLQVLISGRCSKVTLATESAERSGTEIVVTMRVDLGKIDPQTEAGA